MKDIDALSSATQQALRITRDLGGFLVTASYATSDTGVSTLTLKVPTANVQDAVVRLSALGKIVSQQVQIDDLQGQIDDLTKRETALRERIARLSARLAGSDLDAETAGNARGPQGRSPQRARTGAGRSGPGERGSTLRDDPAEPADFTVAPPCRPCRRVGTAGSTEPARSSCSKR